MVTGNDFLSHKKAKITISKRCDYIKIKDLCARKNIYKVKMQATDQQKVSASYRKDKELEPRVNKELLKYRGEKKDSKPKKKTGHVTQEQTQNSQQANAQLFYISCAASDNIK